jgi:NAD-dependent deacetylase
VLLRKGRQDMAVLLLKPDNATEGFRNPVRTRKWRKPVDPLTAQGQDLIDRATKILVFSGAGLSTESGIPDFRSPGGLWSKYDPSDFYYDKFISDETARVKYWKMSTESYRVIRDALPNPAHLAIKALEDIGKLVAIVTQNIDHLHHKAGNSPDKIIEIHGTVFSVSCLNCGKSYDRDAIEDRITSGVKVPYCDECSGILKPDTISFGQAMPADKMTRAIIHAKECDLCITLGSSLVVYPAASIPVYAVENGAALLIINRDPTPLDSKADMVIHQSVTKALKEMVRL